MNLVEFISSTKRNEHIEEPGLVYYVRKSVLFPGVIELAKVQGTNEVPAAFYRFLKRYASTIPFYMENVHNPHLAAYMERLGWRKTYDIGAEDWGAPSYLSPLMSEMFRNDERFQRRFGRGTAYDG